MAFLDKYQEYIADEEIGNKLINLGSCSLQVVNGVFQTGHQASEWQINRLLRAIYRLFKDVPARRAKYIKATGKSVFPSKFCEIRWAQNASSGKTALDVFDDVIQFVKIMKLPQLGFLIAITNT